MKEKDIFKGFSPYFKPKFLHQEPTKTKKGRAHGKVHEVSSDTEITLDSGEKLYVEGELDYSSCYYEGDRPSVKIKITSFRDEEVPNPDYEKELERFLKLKEKFEKENARWKVLKKLWDEKKATEQEQAERKMLKKLKEKYEKE